MLRVGNKVAFDISINVKIRGEMMSMKSNGLLFATTALSLGFALAAPQMALAAPAAQPTVLQDVIVTARRMEERLQDVPISITVFNPQQISNKNIVVAAWLAP